MKLDRFELEQQIMDCWHITSDVETLSNFVGDSTIDPVTKDKLLNMLIGMRELYDLKFSQTLDTFSKLIQDGTIT